MESLWLDLRYAFRSLLQRPGFTALAVLTLALGIGVNTVAFTAIDGLLLRPFRMPEPDRVGWIFLDKSGQQRGAASLNDLSQVAVALAACAVPALRATRADPIDALRQE